MRHEAFFLSHPVFTGREFAEHLSLGGRNGARTKDTILAYHTETGRIVRIRRGLYAAAPPGYDGDSFPIDPYLIASRLTRDSVLSHHTALQFHGRAHTVWQQFSYQATRPAVPTNISAPTCSGARDFRPFSLTVSPRCLAFMTVERANVSLRVASLERTLVDVLNRPQLLRWMGGSMAVSRVGGVLRPRPGRGVRSPAEECDHGGQGGVLPGTAPGPAHGWRGPPCKAPSAPSQGSRTTSIGPDVAVGWSRTWSLVVPMDVMERSWAEVA